MNKIRKLEVSLEKVKLTPRLKAVLIPVLFVIIRRYRAKHARKRKRI